MEAELSISSRSGGVFLLNRAIEAPLNVRLPDGWSAEASSGSTGLIVQGNGRFDSYRESMEEAFGKAQEALDLLSIERGDDRIIENAESEHLAWWTCDGKLVLRDVEVQDLNFSASATATVTNSMGVIVAPAPSPPILWDPSFRYFRLSQTASDLFDAYRNLYLAIESILSSIAPPKKTPSGKWQGEGVWLKDALTTIHSTLIDLANYAPANSADPVDAVFNDLYTLTRTQVFHSKATRPTLLPQSIAGRESVLESQERISRLYVDLVQAHFGVRRPWSILTYAYFESRFRSGVEIVVSDDISPADATDTVVNPAGGRSFPLPTSRHYDPNEPGVVSWLGQASASDVLDNVTDVSRVALLYDGLLFLASKHVKALNLVGVDVFEVSRAVRLVNSKSAKTRFMT